MDTSRERHDKEVRDHFVETMKSFIEMATNQRWHSFLRKCKWLRISHDNAPLRFGVYAKHKYIILDGTKSRRDSLRMRLTRKGGQALIDAGVEGFYLEDNIENKDAIIGKIIWG